jgi:transposase
VELERPGRPSRLSEDQVKKIDLVLRGSPSEYGLTGNLWDGKTLSAFIEEQWGISLGVRQCQRLFRQLGFRLRKPRPLIASADPQLQARIKKTLENGPE